MIVQDRIQELGSAIIDTNTDKLVITGFYSEERLLDYYSRGIDCKSSLGIYPIEDYDIAYIRDNALFIILENSKELMKYKFVSIFKKTLKVKHKDGKYKSFTYRIRKCEFTHQYNYIDSNNNSILFEDEISVKRHIDNKIKRLTLL